MQHLMVQVWRPAKPNVGHSSMTLPDGTYISWWPDGVCSYSHPCLPAQPHTDFQQDAVAEDEEYPPTFSIKVNNEQIDKIKDWWQVFKTTEKYHTISNNCSTVVYTALTIAFPFLGCFKNTNIVWVPVAIQKLAEYLVAEISNFSEKVDEIARAADKEARKIVENGGVKNNKVKIAKLRKSLCKAGDNVQMNKTAIEEKVKSQSSKKGEKKERSSETNSGVDNKGQHSASIKIGDEKGQCMKGNEKKEGKKSINLNMVTVTINNGEDGWEIPIEVNETDDNH